MQSVIPLCRVVVAVGVLAAVGTCSARAAEGAQPTSYAPVNGTESFQSVMTRMKAEKRPLKLKHDAELALRYDLGNKAVPGLRMTRGQAVQGGVRVKLPSGTTWEALARMTPAQIKAKGLFPRGFLPLPHPNHPEGGMTFPQHHIDEINRQEGRDLTRFDLDFDLPRHFLAEYPPAIFLTTRPDLGDVSKGQVITLMNAHDTFNGIMNPKQLEGLRLLVTPFPQQQFNATEDRRSEKPHRGVTCFDCHVNGHTNGTTHLVGDIRPQENRHRLDTPSLRGVNVQRLFGSQRALRSVEDFTEFEQRAAYFDGDPVIAMKKGANVLDRGSQVHFMSEVMSILDFPPAPKLDIFGKLDPSKATKSELAGEKVFNGKARCAECHAAPYYTDNTMHNLQAERFFAPVMMNGRLATGDGSIKTTVLRGIKESPPYLHDGRLLTLDDTIAYFNLITGVKLSAQEKKDLLAFLYTL